MTVTAHEVILEYWNLDDVVTRLMHGVAVDVVEDNAVSLEARQCLVRSSCLAYSKDNIGVRVERSMAFEAEDVLQPAAVGRDLVTEEL